MLLAVSRATRSGQGTLLRQEGTGQLTSFFSCAFTMLCPCAGGMGVHTLRPNRLNRPPLRKCVAAARASFAEIAAPEPELEVAPAQVIGDPAPAARAAAAAQARPPAEACACRRRLAHKPFRQASASVAVLASFLACPGTWFVRHCPQQRQKAGSMALATACGPRARPALGCRGACSRLASLAPMCPGPSEHTALGMQIVICRARALRVGEFCCSK